jgi:hypothetical protein
MKKSTDWPFWNGDLEKFAGKPFEGEWICKASALQVTPAPNT